MARVSGLVSGLDTDALIQELVSAYQTKQDTYVKKQTKLEWTQEIWKGLNTKVYGFYTGALRNARFSSAYNIKKATVSDSTKATVTASSDAVVGTQTLKVNQLAKTAYLTGGKLKRKDKDTDGDGNPDAPDTRKLSGNSKMNELAGFENGTIKVNVKGKEKEFYLDGNSTINSFVVQLKDAGLSASFDEANQRLFVSASSSGKDNEFSIMATNAAGLKALGALGLNSVSKSNADAYKAASEIDVLKEAGTAYTKYVLTEANGRLSADINQYNLELSTWNGKKNYRDDINTRNSMEKSWADRIQAYQKNNKELETENTNLLADDTGSPTSFAGYLAKSGDDYTVDADGYYSFDDQYYEKDSDGTTIKLDENGDKIINRAAFLGLTDDEYNEVVKNLNTLNNNIDAQKANNDLITDVRNQRDEYRQDAGFDVTGLADNDADARIVTADDGTAKLQKDEEVTTDGKTEIVTTDVTGNITTIPEADIEAQIEKLTAQRDVAQKEININNSLMSGSYDYDNISDAATSTDKTTDWTYGELKARLEADIVNETDTAYTDSTGNPVTYGDIKQKVADGTVKAADTAYTQTWTYGALRERLNKYSEVPNGAVDDNGNLLTITSVGTTGLNARADYADEYQKFVDKFTEEQAMGKKLLAAYETYTKDGVSDEEKASAAEILGLDTSPTGAVRVQGQDAEIELNGALFNSTTNNFAVNGLTITATGETGDDEITISTTADIDGMYKSIKSLISGYNDILKEMNTLYYASSAKGYEPLSDAEKEALTDTEVEKWEKKIKDSLLRRDSTLNSIMSVMKNSMAKSYTINGKSYSLSTFGISTSGYFAVDNEDRGLYHIDGDPEDTSTSGNKDKLRAALANDPDAVIQFFQKVSDDLYSQLTKKMSRTSLSSSYTIYNDKQMERQYRDLSQTIDDWDDKIERYTQKYVKQFTAMETAMAKLQSSTSALSGLLG